MFQKIDCAFAILALIVRYKFTRAGGEFWSWLFAFVSNRNGGRKNRCIVWFLLSDALSREDDRSVCVLFEKHGAILSTLNFDQKRIDEIENVFKRTGNHQLIGTVHAEAI
jgi:hypothetical protein